MSSEGGPLGDSPVNSSKADEQPNLTAKVARKFKVTVLGDSGVGKTCLLMTFANNKFPEESINRNSLFENSKGTEGTIKAGQKNTFEVPVILETDEGPIELSLTDTIGTDKYKPFRELFGAKTDVFLVCFSVTEPETLESAQTSWLSELRALSASAPFILVGTKTDLRDEEEVRHRLQQEGKQSIALLKGVKVAKSIGALEYVECSAKNMTSVKNVFHTMLLMIAEKEGRPRRRKKGGQHTCTIS